jgi:hypothetical protein
MYEPGAQQSSADESRVWWSKNGLSGKYTRAVRIRRSVSTNATYRSHALARVHLTWQIHELRATPRRPHTMWNRPPSASIPQPLKLCLQAAAPPMFRRPTSANSWHFSRRPRWFMMRAMVSAANASVKLPGGISTDHRHLCPLKSLARTHPETARTSQRTMRFVVGKCQ